MKFTLAPSGNRAFWQKTFNFERVSSVKLTWQPSFWRLCIIDWKPRKYWRLNALGMLLLWVLLLWCYYFHSPARRGRGTPPTKIVFLGSKGWEPSITKSLSLRFHGRICTWKKVVYLVLTSFPSTPNENKVTKDKPTDLRILQHTQPKQKSSYFLM